MPTIIYRAVSRVVTAAEIPLNQTVFGTFRIYSAYGDVKGAETELINFHCWRIFSTRAVWWELDQAGKPVRPGVLPPAVRIVQSPIVSHLEASAQERRELNEVAMREYEIGDLPAGSVDNETWTAKLMGYTDHGFPFIRNVGLGYVARFSAGMTRGILVPQLAPADGPDKPELDWEFDGSEDADPVLGKAKSIRFKLVSKNDVKLGLDVYLSIELRPALIRRPLLLPLTGVAGKEKDLKGGGDDWRTRLPFEAGQAFDLLSYVVDGARGKVLKREGHYLQLREMVMHLGWQRIDAGLLGADLGDLDHSMNSPDSPFLDFISQVLLLPPADGEARKAFIGKVSAIRPLALTSERIPLPIWKEIVLAALNRTKRENYQFAAAFLSGKAPFDKLDGDQPGIEILSRGLHTCHEAFTDDLLLLEIWFGIWCHLRPSIQQQWVPGELETLIGTGGKDRNPPAAAFRSLQEKLQASGRNLSARYNDALAGRAWKKITDALVANEKRMLGSAEWGIAELRAHSLAVAVASAFMESKPPPATGLDGIAPWFKTGNDGQRRDEMISAVKDWILATSRKLDASSSASTVPHPLRFALADLEMPAGEGEKGSAEEDVRGVLIFCRRPSSMSPSRWQALNLGAMWSLAGNHLLAELGASPVGKTVSNGLPIRSVEYAGAPLGVLLREDEKSGALLVDPASQAPPTAGIVWKQLSASESGAEVLPWSQVPGLGYGWNYEFVQAAIYNDGTIHPDFLAWERNVPAQLPLKSLDEVTALIDSYLLLHPGLLQERLLQRTVPVGSVRLHDGHPMKDVDLPFPAFVFPKLPPTVAPLASVVVRQSIADVERRDLLNRLPVLVLHPDHKMVRFSVRPPAASLEDWMRWIRRNVDGFWHPFRDEVTIAKYIFKVFSQLEAEIPERGRVEVDWRWVTSSADLLDDRAVEKFCLRLELLYAPRLNFVAHSFERELSFSGHWEGVPGLKDYRRISDVISIERDYKLKLEDEVGIERRWDDRKSKLMVGPEEVWRVTIIPVISGDSRLYFEQSLRDFLFEAWKTDLYLAPKAATSFMVEAAHKFQEELKDGETALPTDGELWHALTLSLDNHPDRPLKIELDPEEAASFSPRWGNVSFVGINLQSWVWNGIPPWDYPAVREQPLPAPEVHPGLALFGGNPELNKEKTGNQLSPWEMAFVAAEERAFANRSDADALYVQSAMDWIPVPKDSAGYRSGLTVIHKEAGLPRQHAAFYRVQVTVKSRYLGLPGYESALVKGIMPGSQYPWKRLPAVAVQPRSLQPPRIKMIIPLLRPNTGSRPGFLVLTHNPLPSPFHTVTGKIAVARMRVLSSGEEKVAAEAGPDPILDRGKGGEWAKTLLQSHTLLGRAIGLTFEREAGSPLFPHTAFLFDQLPEDFDFGRLDCDWFVKLTFRWERCVSTATPDLSKSWNREWAQIDTDQSKPTAPWQVRVLAPFEKVDCRNGRDREEVSLERLSFRLAANLSFYVDQVGMESRRKVQISQEDYRERILMLFVTFSDIPDFFNDRPGHSLRSIHLLGPDGPVPLHASSSYPVAPGEKLQGCFVRVLLIPPAVPSSDIASDYMKDKFDLKKLLDALFPAGTSSSEDDSKAMITRISTPIPGET